MPLRISVIPSCSKPANKITGFFVKYICLLKIFILHLYLLGEAKT